ncbi:hypothetical protein [Romboutsia sp.]|uniref:hypothetical protein n=1 Tax=Romboutsia sp. TaxID=1965302 RepID=UPI003F325C35
MNFLKDELYIENITRLYENYLSKFKKNKSRFYDIDKSNQSEEIEDFNEINSLDIFEELDCNLCDDDQFFLNKLLSPEDYLSSLSSLIKEKVDYNFKNLSHYGVDRSYLNRILKGNSPSKNTLISIGYFLNLNLEEMSELLNVYGFAFGNSTDDRVVYFAFSNRFKYNQFLEFVDLHGSNFLKKFFSK